MGTDAWYATVDIDKAFGRVNYMEMLQALKEEDLQNDVVAAMQRMNLELRECVQLWPQECTK